MFKFDFDQNDPTKSFIITRILTHRKEYEMARNWSQYFPKRNKSNKCQEQPRCKQDVVRTTYSGAFKGEVQSQLGINDISNLF